MIPVHFSSALEAVITLCRNNFLMTYMGSHKIVEVIKAVTITTQWSILIGL